MRNSSSACLVEFSSLPPASRSGLADLDEVTWELIMDRGLIAGRVGTVVRDFVDHSEDLASISRTVAIEVARRETAVYLVLAGAGIAVFPEPLARAMEQLGAVARPVTPTVSRDVLLCCRRAPFSPGVKAFLGYLKPGEGIAASGSILG